MPLALSAAPFWNQTGHLHRDQWTCITRRLPVDM